MENPGILVLVLAVVGIVLYLMLRDRKPVVKPDEPVKPPVDLSNNPPIIFHPMFPRLMTKYLINNELVVLDYRHRRLGCESSGAPTDEVGAYDPEGGMLEYKIVATMKLVDGRVVPYPVFSMASKWRVDNKWLTPGTPDLPIAVKNSQTGELEPLAVFGLVVGHTSSEAPLLVRVVDVNAEIVTPKACGGGSTPEPAPEDSTGEKVGVLVITTTVRDPKGAVAADAVAFEVYRGCS